jgi:signal transduction histidine kinase
LLHDPTLLERRDLLDGVLAAAALSIEMARLRVEVRLQLAEVHSSRARIVEAGYEERRRLERDLHDGAQQRLVSLGVQVRRLQLSLPRDAMILSPALDQIVAEVGSAIADLRQIAAGVRPARLDEGLAAALHDLARTSPVPIVVEASSERVPASIEAAAYFVACEALTNAVKHGSPSKVTVRTVQDNGTLHVTVADDGVGGAVVRRGSGLAGLRDRVAAHGGTLEIVSPRGNGTRVEVASHADRDRGGRSAAPRGTRRLLETPVAPSRVSGHRSSPGCRQRLTSPSSTSAYRRLGRRRMRRARSADHTRGPRSSSSRSMWRVATPSSW